MSLAWTLFKTTVFVGTLSYNVVSCMHDGLEERYRTMTAQQKSSFLAQKYTELSPEERSKMLPELAEKLGEEHFRSFVHDSYAAGEKKYSNGLKVLKEIAVDQSRKKMLHGKDMLEGLVHELSKYR